MLVKIIALGLSPAIWKNVFHHLRGQLPRHPFAAGIFTGPDEVGFLTREFFPGQWRHERPDVLLCEPPGGQDWQQRLEFLRAVQALGEDAPAVVALVLRTLEGGLRQLVQGPVPVELELDNGTALRVSDPALVIHSFPSDFPRLRVNDHLTSLFLKRPGKSAAEMRPEVLQAGTLLGFAELEAIRHGNETLAPEDWLRRVLKATKERLPRSGCPGLIREARGLFLFPGIPQGRIAEVRLGDVTIRHLIDLGQLTPEAPGYRSLVQAVRRRGDYHRQQWELHTDRIRVAETKTDLPVVCGGGPELLRETLASLLGRRGFQRCSTLEVPGEGAFREPALLLQLGPWRREEEGAQVEEPQRYPLEEELAPLLAPLDGFVDWRALPYAAVGDGAAPLSDKAFHDRRDGIALRDRKTAQGLDLAQKREVLLAQERDVLHQAQAKLADLLEAGDALQVWTGRLPTRARQVLVFSHDQEEAGAVLQALPNVAKKRWFDLSPFTTPEALRRLSLEPVAHYREGGVMIVTAASRERLRELQARVQADLDASDEALEETRAAQRFYAEEQDRVLREKEELARRWLRDALGRWLDGQMDDLLERLGILRARHERRWFSRALVNRLAVVPSSGENRAPLLAACRTLFPGLNEEHSRVVHYDYEPLDALPAEEREAVVRMSREQGEPAEVLRRRLEESLEAQNAERFAAYLQVLTAELEDLRADLLLVEHRREVAFAVLEHVRRSLPAMAEVPAILVLPDYWAPEPDAPMPWPRARVVLLRRMGALPHEETLDSLRALFSA